MKKIKNKELEKKDKKYLQSCPDCGCLEFISNPNRYDVYEIDEEDGKLYLSNTEYIDDNNISCRECGVSFDLDNFNLK